MKTIKIFKWSIPAWVIATIALVGVGSAVLVSYISNTITASTTVQSPMQVKVSTDDSTWQDSISLGTIYGGESVTFYVKTTNLASTSESRTMWNVVNNPNGITCADFTLTSTDTGYVNPVFPQTDTTSSLLCGQIDAYNVRIKTTPTEPWTWDANHLDVGKFTVTFASAASGTYTLTSYIKP